MQNNEKLSTGYLSIEYRPVIGWTHLMSGHLSFRQKMSVQFIPVALYTPLLPVNAKKYRGIINCCQILHISRPSVNVMDVRRVSTQSACKQPSSAASAASVEQRMRMRLRRAAERGLVAMWLCWPVAVKWRQTDQTLTDQSTAQTPLLRFVVDFL